MRQFVQAFLVSRIMYELPYHAVNRTQIIKLDLLLNKAKRMVTRLPRYARLDALKSCSKLNNLTELVDMCVYSHTQETRLRATNAGRYTLMLLRLCAPATIKRAPWPSSLRTRACLESSLPVHAIGFWRALTLFLQDSAAPPVGDRLRDSNKIQAAQAAST
ncbi:hypothetical protein MRX96_021168 [Rhipicephalus microplus]